MEKKCLLIGTREYFQEELLGTPQKRFGMQRKIQEASYFLRGKMCLNFYSLLSNWNFSQDRRGVSPAKLKFHPLTIQFNQIWQYYPWNASRLLWLGIYYKTHPHLTFIQKICLLFIVGMMCISFTLCVRVEIMLKDLICDGFIFWMELPNFTHFKRL